MARGTTVDFRGFRNIRGSGKVKPTQVIRGCESYWRTGTVTRFSASRGHRAVLTNRRTSESCSTNCETRGIAGTNNVNNSDTLAQCRLDSSGAVCLEIGVCWDMVPIRSLEALRKANLSIVNTEIAESIIGRGRTGTG